MMFFDTVIDYLLQLFVVVFEQSRMEDRFFNMRVSIELCLDFFKDSYMVSDFVCFNDFKQFIEFVMVF